MTTRGLAKLTAVAAAVLSCLAPATPDPAPPAAWKKLRLSPRVLVMTVEPAQQNNSIVLATKRGLAVIDTNLSASSARTIREEARREFGREDFRFVINTHEDWDHVQGNQAFPEAEIVAHQACREAMLKDKLSEPRRIAEDLAMVGGWLAGFRKELETAKPGTPEAERLRIRIERFETYARDLGDGFHFTPPTIAFSNRLTLDLGDLTIELVYYGPAQRTGDILVSVPEEGLLATGDLSFDFDIGRAYEQDEAYRHGLDVDRWLACLDEVLADPSGGRWIVRGHRPELLARKDLEDRRDYLKKAWEGVLAGKKEAKALETVQAELANALINSEVLAWKDWWSGQPLKEDVIRERQAKLISLLWTEADKAGTEGR